MSYLLSGPGSLSERLLSTLGEPGVVAAITVAWDIYRRGFSSKSQILSLTVPGPLATGGIAFAASASSQIVHNFILPYIQDSPKAVEWEAFIGQPIWQAVAGSYLYLLANMKAEPYLPLGQVILAFAGSEALGQYLWMKSTTLA